MIDFKEIINWKAVWDVTLIKLQEFWLVITIASLIIIVTAYKKYKERKLMKEEIKMRLEKKEEELPKPEDYGMPPTQKEELPVFGEDMFFNSTEKNNIPELIDQVNGLISKDSENLTAQARRDLENFEKTLTDVIDMKENIEKQGRKLGVMFKDYENREKNIKQSIDGLKRTLNKGK